MRVHSWALAIEPQHFDRPGRLRGFMSSTIELMFFRVSHQAPSIVFALGYTGSGGASATITTSLSRDPSDDGHVGQY